MSLHLFSETYLNVVFWMAMAIMVVCVVLLVVIQVIRFIAQWGHWRERRMFKQWQYLLLETPHLPENLPPLPAGDMLRFMSLWNYMHASFRGEIKATFNQVGKMVALDDYARKLLKSTNLFKKMMAMTALGHFQDKSVWDELSGHMHSQGTSLSIVAVRSLVHIDPERALPELLTALANRPDWPIAKIDSILNDVESVDVHTFLLQALFQSSPEVVINLIKYLQYSNNVLATPSLRKMLQTAADFRVLASCIAALAHFRDKTCIKEIRQFVFHSDWVVRIHAVSALGKIGTAEDVGIVLKLLCDSSWWVRYRAAQALAELPMVDLETLKHYQQKQTDLYAREILAHVIAETNRG